MNIKLHLLQKTNISLTPVEKILYALNLSSQAALASMLCKAPTKHSHVLKLTKANHFQSSKITRTETISRLIDWLKLNLQPF